ncbi:chitin synthase [Geobacter sp. SVR]|nr:chitin synthase [Geobacter sp. SVR]GCF86635.1 chitin synthase [Geobacter sp. SVR]
MTFPAHSTSKRRSPVILCAVLGACALLGGIACARETADLFRQGLLGTTLLLFTLVSVALFGAELIWRALLALGYRPIPGCADELLPACTVVVPAYNEGRQVYVTLQSLAASDYPHDKLRLIAVDDGSVDDTWLWIQKAKEHLGDRLTIIRQPHNRGKRHALYAGFRQSAGDILVTVDSDSIVTADTLRNLVSPFVMDHRVGAVAGNVRVLNRDKGIIPRMLDVAFVYSFDFIRASQSMVGSVMCTPGALAAYRTNAVAAVLQEWLHQTFCGQPANIGEDRALTNLIIREGHHVLFQQNSLVYTEVPVTYANLCKMYLRWARSDVREILAMTRFIFTDFRRESMIGTRLNLLFNWIAIIKVPVFTLVTGVALTLHLATFGFGTVLGVILAASLAAVIYAWKFGTFDSLWAFVYGFYSFLALSWIGPYALVTFHRSGWLTRQVSSTPTIGRTEPLYSGSKIFLHEVKILD